VAARTSVEWLLDDLCESLGFCLPPDARRRLAQRPPSGIDAFTDAVFLAEGLDPEDDEELRKQVRDLVVKHLKPKEN
jgi:hypothetical protein